MKEEKLKTVYSAVVRGGPLDALAAELARIGYDVSTTTRQDANGKPHVDSIRVNDYDSFELNPIVMGIFSWKALVFGRSVQAGAPRRVPA